MAPKPRDPKNSDLTGTNIKVTRAKLVDGIKEYWNYTRPDGGKKIPLHKFASSREEAVQLAHVMNIELGSKTTLIEQLMERIAPKPAAPTTSNPLMIEVLALFEAEWLPERGLKPGTLKQRIIKLNQYRSHWPHERIEDISPFLVKQFTKQFSVEAERQHLIFLKQIFDFAESNGFKTQRPMQVVQKRKQQKRKRARHTWEGYKAIYDACPQWLKNACDAALYTLQRRADLVAIRIKEQIDMEARTIKILQAKSENYDKPVFIEIAMGDDLFKAVRSSISSEVLCPFLIHHQQRQTTKTRKAKAHPFAVTPDYLTRAYTEVRDRVGVYNHLPILERPGFHSIRALGIWLYTKAGYSDEYIMALAGHATETMKARYTAGHEKREPLKVAAGLDLSAVDLRSVNWQTDLSKSLRSIVDEE